MTALSAREMALIMEVVVLLFFALRIAISSLVLKSLFTVCFLVELLSALLAVFVTGIVLLIECFFLKKLKKKIP